MQAAAMTPSPVPFRVPIPLPTCNQLTVLTRLELSASTWPLSPGSPGRLGPTVFGAVSFVAAPLGTQPPSHTHTHICFRVLR